MQYIAKIKGNRSITVFDEHDEEIGALIYLSLFSRKAQISTSDNRIYDVIPAGFWLNKVEINQNGVPYASVKYNLGRGANICFENGMNLTVRLKSIWRYEYSILDNDGLEIGNIYVNFRWRTLSYFYEINLPATPKAQLNIMLPIVLAYCTEYLRMRKR
ncbi:MAG: hypothetical protein JSS96_14330 [Bacteroidetes bacterium]|nr:hypothetical protein [Bacteroidota bacterium]